MNLRTRTILIVGVATIIFLCVLLISFHSILKGDFSRIEEQAARLAINEAYVAFNNDLFDLTDLTNQLATESDTKAFLQNPNSANLKKSVADSAFKRQRISYILLLNKQGKIIYSAGYDRAKKVQTTLPPSLLEMISPQSLLLKHDNARSSHSGVLSLQEKPLFITSQAVTEIKSTEKINGTIILTQWLDFSETSHLSRLSRTSVSVHYVGKQNSSDDLRRIVDSISDDNPIFIKSSNLEMASYKLVNDIFGLPAFLIKASQNRLIFQRNNWMFNFRFFLIVIIAAVFFILIIFVLLDKMILAKLANISKQIRGIAASGNYKSRISVDRKDELTAMGYSINFLLIKLDQTEKALHDKSVLYKHITENMLEIVVQTDLQGIYQYISPSHKTLLGHHAEKLLGKSIFDLIHPQDVKNVFDLFTDHINKNTQAKFECRFHHSAGNYVRMDVIANPLLDKNGSPIGSIIIARDINDGKESEKLPA
jgi:PAS domain S-box-containing protein